jgi:hypothetical protein
MKKYFFCLLPFFAFLLVMCNKNEDNREELVLTYEYFPLETGNYWQIENSGIIEVIGTENIKNKTFSIFSTPYDTSYYRVENNNVYAIEYKGEESVKFDLAANVGDTWNYNNYEVTLCSKTDTLQVGDYQLINCYRYYYDVPVSIDEEHSIWLAPGIGIVQWQCGECFQQISQVTKVSIAGQIIDF